MDEVALYTKQKINFQPSSTISHFAACNNIIVVCTENGKLLRIPLQEHEKQTETDVFSSSSDRIEFIHLDPTGQNLLISLKSGDALYFHPAMKKPVSLPKMKGNIITAVSWNEDYSKESSTGFILIGTSRGLLFETEILSSGVQTYFRQVWCASEDTTNPSPITGLFMRRCDNDGKRWMILVATTGQLFPFAGNIGNPSPGPTLQSVFQTENESRRSLSLMSSAGAAEEREKRVASQLHLFPPWADRTVSYVAWLESPGIQHGAMDQTASDPYKMFTNQKLLSHPVVNGAHERPLGIVLTEFHIMILYQDRVAAVCTVNERVAYEDILGKRFGRPIGITRDPISGIIWVYTSNSVLRYKTTDETQYLWSVFLELGDYVQARKFAANNPKNLDVVLRSQAAKLFKDRNYSAAAEMFALTQAPFEEVSLKFINLEERSSLKIYLQKKLDSLDDADRSRKCLLIIWLLEILLTELGEGRVGVPVRAKRRGAQESSAAKEETESIDSSLRFKTVRQQLAVFLKRPDVKECIESNREAVMRMMSNHGDMESLLYFAEITRDFDTVVTLYVQQQQHEDALGVIVKQANASLYYKFSPDLVRFAPSELVNAWINAGALLKPTYLLPALYHCEKDERLASEAIRYLEFCVSKLDVDDVSVHNLLVSLYVSFQQPERLMNYLESQGREGSMVKYDTKYALRLCLDRNFLHSAVHVYCTMGLFEEAVNLALKVDVDLAKRCASLPADNFELRRKLWLCVTRHVVAKEKDIAKCMELLQASDGLIKIQDLLPFFPDFVTIDHFKDALCNCLIERSGKIQALQEEMKEATDVAEQIKKQIKSSRNKYSIVRTQDKCVTCKGGLMSRAFYCFPCRHNFHADCLETECVSLMTKEQKQRVARLRRQIANIEQAAQSMSIDSESVLSQNRQAGANGNLLERTPQMEMDELLAGECPFCGSLIINAVDRPFFTPSEYIHEQKNWD